MTRIAIACALVVAISSQARADVATAQAAYVQAEALAQQGKWAEACPLYEASYRADRQLGALLHLADCHEHVGRLATAWAEFTDAVALAKSKGDKREALAQGRADALLPRLAKLRIAPPPQIYPGLVVTRDGVDITVLVGTDMPIDPGDHEIVASAPGYLPWKSKTTITTGTATLAIAALQKQPEKPVDTTPREGTITITAPENAEIFLDGTKVGTGTFEGKLATGGHTLRVTAEGMRPYQTEITVSEGARAIPVSLEKDAPVIVAKPAENEPSFELGASFGGGVKLRADNPAVVTLRAEAAFRIGKRVNFGLYTEYGSINTSGRCGFDMPGPTPSTVVDFGPRNQFNKCDYLMPGLQLYVHARPKRALDPYFGVGPGFKFGFVQWTPYMAGVAQPKQDAIFPAIVVNARVGIDYFPKPTSNWQVGAFIDAAFTAIGDENAHDIDVDQNSRASFAIFGGLRTSTKF